MLLAGSLSGCGGLNVSFEPLPGGELDEHDRDAYSVSRETLDRRERILRERRWKEKEDRERAKAADRLAETIHTPAEPEGSKK